VERRELHVHNLEVQRVEKVEDWYAAIKQAGWFVARPAAEGAGAPPAGAAGGAIPVTIPPAAAPGGVAPAGGLPAAGAPGGPATAAPSPTPAASPGSTPGGTPAGAGAGPTGPGWIVQITGYHDHNPKDPNLPQGAVYTEDTLITDLERKSVLLPTGNKQKNAKGEETDEEDFVSMKELGISCPVLIDPQQVREEEIQDLSVPLGASTGTAGPVGMGSRGIMGQGFHGLGDKGEDKVKTVKVRRFHFVVQFCWQPVLPSERAKKKADKEKADQKAKDQAAGKP